MKLVISVLLSVFLAATSIAWAGPVPHTADPASPVPTVNQIISANGLRKAGFLGQGVRVGVISNGVGNYAVLSAHHILPEGIPIFDRKNQRGDEGDWLMQVVHQIAPRAKLAFCPVHVVACAAKLIRNFHAQVVVWDMNWRTVSFSPLPVVRGLAALHRQYPNVLFFTGAGNFAGTYYTALWTSTAWRLGGHEVLAQDFGRSTGAPANLYDPFQLPARNARIKRIVLTAAVRRTADMGACPHLPLRMVLLDGQNRVIETAAAPEQGKNCGEIRLATTPSQLPGLGENEEYRVALVAPEKLREARFRIRLNGFFVAGARHGSIHFRYATTGTAGANAGPTDRTGVLSVVPLDPNTTLRGRPAREFYGGAGPACYLPLRSHAGNTRGEQLACWRQPSISAPDQAIVAFPAQNADGYRYRAFHGGSNAGPVAAGATALLLSAGIPAQKIPNLLERTARPLAGSGEWNAFYGFGLIDADAAARESGALRRTAAQPARPPSGNAGAVDRKLVAQAREGNQAALRQLEEAARSGSGTAALEAGEIFRKNQQDRLAARFFWRAAQAGLPRAQYDLGVAFARGWAAAAPDGWAAIVWWQRAAEQGEPRAFCQLSEAYANRPQTTGGRRIMSPVPFRPRLALALADACSLRGVKTAAENGRSVQAATAKLSTEDIRRAQSLARRIVRDPRRYLPSLHYEFVPRDSRER